MVDTCLVMNEERSLHIPRQDGMCSLSVSGQSSPTQQRTRPAPERLISMDRNGCQITAHASSLGPKEGKGDANKACEEVIEH
jgi:hypothetical protein